jgi:hypothetical protein
MSRARCQEQLKLTRELRVDSERNALFRSDGAT